jgi:hypothetical protein
MSALTRSIASTSTRKIVAVAAVTGLACATGLLVGIAGSADAAQGTPPPWVVSGVNQDANAVGGLEFFNGAGAQITSGSLTGSPFAAFAVGLKQTRTTDVPDTKATLFAYVPQVGKTPDTWATDEQIGVSSTYPVPTAPAPIGGANTLPVNTGGAGDKTIGTVAADLPNTATATGYLNVYEIRMYTNAKFQVQSTTYDYADIVVNTSAGTWSQVYSPDNPLSGGPTTTPPTTTPPVTTPPVTTPPVTTPPVTTPPVTTPPVTTPPVTTPPVTTPPVTSSSSSTPPTTGDVTAVGSDGTPLGDNPSLSPGDTVTITVTGFSEDETVAVTLHSTAVDLGTVKADSSGTVTFPFTVPADIAAGAHHINFAGSHNDGTFAFLAALSATSGSSSSSGGTIATTGFDTALFGGLATLLLAIGTVLLLSGRRLVRSTGRHAR